LTLAAGALLGGCGPEQPPITDTNQREFDVVLMPVAADPTVALSVSFAVGSQMTLDIQSSAFRVTLIS
jgi:hypothetical protein